MGGLRITVGDVTLTASSTDETPDIRDALAAALLVAGDATRWGDERYFSVPVTVPTANVREMVPVGAVAYWPRRNALCLFWGPTPASTDDQPRAASLVTVVADIENPSPLDAAAGAAYVRAETA